MDIRQIEYVLAVVEHGTFTAAAESIPVSQPALSQGIGALERELGIPLFNRIGRTVTLSEAGHAFVRPARQLQQDHRSVAEAVAMVAGLEGGALDLVSLPTLAVAPLVELIGRFRQAHPAVGLRIHEREGGTDEAIELVRDGTCELGLVEFTGGEPPAGLNGHRLKDQVFLAVCPPGSHRPRNGRIDAAGFAELPIATTPIGTSSRRLLDEVFAAGETRSPHIVVESSHRELLLPLVISGAAAALLPASVADEAHRQGAVVLELDPPVHRRIGLAHRPGVLSPAAQAFMALAG